MSSLIVSSSKKRRYIKTKMANDNVYKDGDIVWVKWNNHWWPGEVTGIERQPEGLIKQLKRKPYCVVKFFNEDTYECIHSPKKILPYECLKKDEFIKKGYSLLNNKNKCMEKFPADIEIAEQLICHKNHVTINNRPDSIVKVILGQPLVRDTNSKLSFNSSTNTHYNATRRDSIMQILDLTPKYDFQEVDFSKTTINANSQATSAAITSEPVSQGVKEGNFYQCNFCDFTSFRQNVMILHRKMHNDKNAVKIPASTTNRTFSNVTKSVDLANQLSENDHKKVKKSAHLRNQYTNFAITEADPVNNELHQSEKFATNKRRENGKDDKNVEEISTCRSQGLVLKENGSINLHTTLQSLELRQCLATCRLPKKKELASLALRELSEELMEVEGNIDNDIDFQTITDSTTNVIPKVLSPKSVPKHVGEEIKKILADWSDEEDVTIETELKNKKQPKNVHQITMLSHFIDSSLPSKSIASPSATVDTKPSGRIRNIPKKDRRDMVLHDFNNDLIECMANTKNQTKHANDLPIASVDNSSTASDSSLVEIVEDDNYSAVIVIQDDENYVSDENVGTKHKSNEQIMDKTNLFSEIHVSVVKKSDHSMKSSAVSCFDFQEDDMIEKNAKTNVSTTQKYLLDSELTKEVEQLLEQTVISISNVKSTISSNTKHVVSENFLRSKEPLVHVKDLPIKERSKRIFKSRNLTHLGVTSKTSPRKEKGLTKQNNDENIKEKNNVEYRNALMIIDQKQNITKPDGAKFEILENISVEISHKDLTANIEQTHGANSNTSPDTNNKNENSHLQKSTQKDNHTLQFSDINVAFTDKTHIIAKDKTHQPAYVNNDQQTKLRLMTSDLQDALIFETPIDENSSLTASDTGAEFGSPTSTLDEERMTTFESNIKANIIGSATKEIHKSNEYVHNKVDSDVANMVKITFVKQSADMISTVENKPTTYKNNFLKHKHYCKQTQGQSLTSHIRRLTLEKMEHLHSFLPSTKEKLKTKSVSLTNLEECNNGKQSLFNLHHRASSFKRESKCLSDTVLQSVGKVDKKRNSYDNIENNLIIVPPANIQMNSENQEIETNVNQDLSSNSEAQILNELCIGHQQTEEVSMENCNTEDLEDEKILELEQDEKTNKVDKREPVLSTNEILTISAQVHDTDETNNRVRRNECKQPVKVQSKNSNIEFEEAIASANNANRTVESSYTISKESNKGESSYNENSLVETTVNEPNICVSLHLNNSNVRKRKLSSDKLIADCSDFESSTNKGKDLNNCKMGKKRTQSLNLDSNISNIQTSIVIQKRNSNQSLKKDLKCKEYEARISDCPKFATLNDKDDELTVITKKINQLNERACPEGTANSTSRSKRKETTKNKGMIQFITNTGLQMQSCQRINEIDGLQNDSVNSASNELRVITSSDTEEMLQNADSPSKIVTALRSDPLVTDQELLDIKILQTDTTTQLDDEFLIEFDSIVNNQAQNCKQTTKETSLSKCNMTKTHEVVEQTRHLPLCSEETLNAEASCTLNIFQSSHCKSGKIGKRRRKTISSDTCTNQDIMYKVVRHNHRKRKMSSDSFYSDRAKSLQQAMSASMILELSPSKKLHCNPNQSKKSSELSSTNITGGFLSSKGEIFDLSATILELHNEDLLPDLPETVGNSIKINTGVDDLREHQSQKYTLKILGQDLISSQCLVTHNNTMPLKQNLLDKEYKPSAKTVGGITSRIPNKNQQIGTDSRGNKYVIIKTPAHNLKVHPAPIQTKITKNLTTDANNIVIFPRDDCINVMSPQKDKNKLIDNTVFQRQKRTSLVTKPKNECNKEGIPTLHKKLNCEATSLNKIPATSVVNIHNQLNSDKLGFSVASEVSFKAQQQLLLLQQQHALQLPSTNTINENQMNQSQRKSRKISQNKVSSKSLPFEQRESQHQQVTHDEIPQNSLGGLGKKNIVNQDAMETEESIDQTSKILAVPTQPIPGYNETFLLCTLVDNMYKPIDNVPLYLNHDLNQLVPVPLETLMDEPRLIVNHPICSINEHSSPQKKSEISILNSESGTRSNEAEDGCNENASIEVEGPLLVLPPNFIEETIIDETSSEVQPINDGQLTLLQSNESNHALVPNNAIILNIEGQQVVLDANTFAHLLANPDANTQLVTDGGTEFILTREVLAALQIQHDVQPVALEQQHQQQQISLEENSHNLLTVNLEGSNLYSTDVLEIDTSQNLQLISTDANILFQSTVSLTQPHLTPPIQANVNETNALLDQTPIMSTSESPSNAPIYRKTKVTSLLASGGVLTTSEAIDSFSTDNLRPNLEDSLAAIGVTTQSSIVPSSLDLPITVTNPNIAPKVNCAPLIDMVQFAPPRSASAVATAVAVAALANEGGLFNDRAS